MRTEPHAAAPRHRFPVRVYFEDTDAGGIVYYANYLKFAERARTEMMRAAGAEHAAMMRESGTMFAVRRCEADFLAPARLDDALEVETAIVELGRASLWAEQIVRRDGQDLARLRVRLACIGADGRPAALPKRVRAALDPAPGPGPQRKERH
jgi:acyl-CoA thioester hydrolase